MAYSRLYVKDASGQAKEARAGDHSSSPAVSSNATDAASTITAAVIQNGLYDRSGLTVGRTDTLDTAANLAAALPNMDIGDSFQLLVNNRSGQLLTVAAGAGVTLVGTANVAANSQKWLTFVRTGAATFSVYGT